MNKMKKSILGAAIGAVLAMGQGCSEALAEQAEQEAAIKEKAGALIEQSKKDCKELANKTSVVIVLNRNIGVPAYRMRQIFADTISSDFKQVMTEVVNTIYRPYPSIDYEGANRITYDRCTKYWLKKIEDAKANG